MTQTSFRAMVVEETADGRFERRITDKAVSDLPKGDLLIKVHYSSLNYKDALSANGNKGVTRRYPHTPGIDAAGEVVHSDVSNFAQGARVLITGYDLGMNTSGGFGQLVSVPAQWVVPLPENLTLKQSMMFGTAGFTAAMSIFKLEENAVTPSSGKILVTGATGGVGSMATAILSHCGYDVVALTGKTDAHGYLTKLGAKEILSREKVLSAPKKAILPSRYAAVIDTVGGEILSYGIRTTQYGGVVTCCGNAASGDLNITVYPFILRGIQLSGIDSAECPMDYRLKIWEKLAGPWRVPEMENFVTEIGLEELPPRIDAMLAGGVTGRFVINLNL